MVVKEREGIDNSNPKFSIRKWNRNENENENENEKGK